MRAWSLVDTSGLLRIMLVLILMAYGPCSNGAQEPAKKEGWWERQFRQFHSYGHLDRAYRAARDGQLQEARYQFEQYLTVMPDDREAKQAYVNVLGQLEDYPAVLRSADELLAQDSALDAMRLQRAVARQHLGQVDGAIDDYLRVGQSTMMTESDRQFALNMAAHLASEINSNDVALTALDALAGASEPSYEVQLRRGHLLHKLARPPQAEAAYRSAVDLAASELQRLEALRALGTTLAEQQRWDDAERVLLLAYDLDPHHLDTLSGLAEIAWARRDYDKTRRWATARLEVSFDHRAQELLATALSETGDYEAAVTALLPLANAATNEVTRERFALMLARAHFGAKNYPSAIEWAQRSLDAGATQPAREVLARAYFEAGKYDQAALHFEQLAATASSAREQDEFSMSLGYTYMNLARYNRAAATFGSVAPRDPTPTARLAQAEALRKLDDRPSLQSVYQELLSRRDLPATTRERVTKQLGFLLREMRNLPAAMETLHVAVTKSEHDWQSRFALAITQYEASRFREALTNFLAVVHQRPSAEARLYVALCYKQLGKSGLATYYLERARDDINSLAPVSAAYVHEELAELYAGESDYAKAAESLRAALRITQGTANVIKLARLERLAGNSSEGLRLLERVNINELSSYELATFYDEQADAYLRLDRHVDAANALTQAIAIAPTADRHYRVALAHQATGHLIRTQRALEAALAAEPANNEFAATLGYVYSRQRQPVKAAQLFETILAREPDYPGLHAELGYLYSRLGLNAEAQLHFRHAVDAAASVAAAVNDEAVNDQAVNGNARIEREPALYALRGEVSKLANRVDIEGYHVLPPDYDADSGSTDAPAAGYAPAQGGLTVAYQPPNLGLRDERIFQVTGRVLWQVSENSQRIDRNSLQAGLGARYKPLRDHNLYLSGERLLKIGEAARNDWLVRAQYSLTQGLTLAPGRESSRYRSAYADVAAALSGTRWRSYYGEWREGVTFALREAVMVSPYAVLDVRGVAERLFGDDVAEAGAGVSLRAYFAKSHYHAPAGQFELNVQYKMSVADRETGLTTMFALRY